MVNVVCKTLAHFADILERHERGYRLNNDFAEEMARQIKEVIRRNDDLVSALTDLVAICEVRGHVVDAALPTKWQPREVAKAIRILEKCHEPLEKAEPTGG